MLQQLQIYSNGVWQLSPIEKDSIIAWRLVHRTCFFDIYSKYTWEAGYMHSYNAILSRDSLLTADSQDTTYAGRSRALDYTGLSSLSYMSPQPSSAVITNTSACCLDHKISTTAVKPMEQMRGHTDHAAFRTTRNIILYPEYMENINDYRSLCNADTTTENMEEDKRAV